MSYKSILVHVDNSPGSKQRVTLAIELAQAHQAHLMGVAPTGILYLPFGAGGDVTGLYYEQAVTALKETAQNGIDAFEQQVRFAGLASTECHRVDDDANVALTLHGRYADLIILSQKDPNVTGIAIDTVRPEHVLLHAARPVLIVPYAGSFSNIGQQVMIAWNASRESARAVSDAMPLLKKAKKVHVTVFNAAQNFVDMHGQKPGADIELFLMRHGVKVEVSHVETSIDIGNTLLSRMADYNSDLLVMGGYGHSRFRETILGGVTKTILEHMTVPVLLSH